MSRKLVSIVGLGMGNIFGLMLRFMPTWWSFLIFWVLMMGTIHAAHISASVYETDSIPYNEPNYHSQYIGFCRLK